MNLRKVLLVITNHEKTISKRESKELKYKDLYDFSNTYKSNHNSLD